MPISLDDLAPYRSLLLCECPAKWNMTDAVAMLRQHVQNLDGIVSVSRASPDSTRYGVRENHFYYCRKGQPAWLLTKALEDKLHELIVVLTKGRFVAILATESSVRDQLRSKFNDANNRTLGELKPLPAAVFNAAFVRGTTHTLWLSGTHRRVASTVDNKVISGSDLLYALDPLGDQTFFFTAAVSRLPANSYPHKVGVSPRRSYVWAGPSETGASLCKAVALLSRLIQQSAAHPIENPLPVLATPAMDAQSLASVFGAYEAALAPTELLQYELSADERAMAEKWNRLEFEITATANADFTSNLTLYDDAGGSTALGAVHVRFDFAKPDRIYWQATSAVPPHPATPLHQEAIRIINGRRSWFKVWYESGHSLAEQAIFRTRLRDAQFDYCFCNFRGFDVTKEKPRPLTVPNIGAGDSLFCWVRREWHRVLPLAGVVSGWLACNDGSMEIADFIHYDVINGEPELSLIHVKGSKTAGANRQLSVTDYEIVVGQAIKNLRFMDLQNNIAAFKDFLSRKLMNAAWTSGAPNTRDNMLRAMGANGRAPKRRVIIVQPRCTQTALTSARGRGNAKQTLIAQQMDMLLLSARANCQAMGADFSVIVDNI